MVWFTMQVYVNESVWYVLGTFNNTPIKKYKNTTQRTDHRSTFIFRHRHRDMNGTHWALLFAFVSNWQHSFFFFCSKSRSIFSAAKLSDERKKAESSVLLSRRASKHWTFITKVTIQPKHLDSRRNNIIACHLMSDGSMPFAISIKLDIFFSFYGPWICILLPAHLAEFISFAKLEWVRRVDVDAT